MKKLIINILFLLILIPVSCNLFAQSGPGGVGNNTSNKLWLRAIDINLSDNDTISVWPDTSGNDNDASQTGINRPVYRTNIINNKPVARFDGNDFFSNIFNVASQNMTIFCVFSHDIDGSGSPNDGPLWSTNANNNNGSVFLPLYDSVIGDIQRFNTGVWLEQNPSTFNQNTWYSITGTHGIGESELWKNGSLNDNNTTNTVALGPFQIGKLTTNHYYVGDIAELIYYNYNLNNAERIIVDNYLAAKYNLAIANDKYSYNATYGYDVAGIGREDASNTNESAQSAKLLKISSPSDMTDGEYILFGHDSGSVSSWTIAENPKSGCGIKTYRVAREWKIDETGDLGTITVSLDTSLLPALPAAYKAYVLWVDTDGDGDFTTGNPDEYLMTLNGSEYKASQVQVADGNYITFGTAKAIQFTITHSNGPENTSPVNIEISLYSVISSDDALVDYTVTGDCCRCRC